MKPGEFTMEPGRFTMEPGRFTMMSERFTMEPGELLSNTSHTKNLKNEIR